MRSMEADGAEVAGGEARRDGVGAGGTIGRAERLHAPAALALGEAWRRRRSRPAASARISGSETKGMSQATQTTGAGASTTAV